MFFVIFAFLENSRPLVQAEFKPQKKTQTIDYGKAIIDEPYEMPYVYIYFVCQHATYNFSSERERINETLDSLLQSQNYFLNSSHITYESGFDRHILPIQEVKAFYDEEKVYEQHFHGYFRLKLSDPDPTLGPFE